MSFTFYTCDDKFGYNLTIKLTSTPVQGISNTLPEIQKLNCIAVKLVLRWRNIIIYFQMFCGRLFWNITHSVIQSYTVAIIFEEYAVQVASFRVFPQDKYL